MADPLDAYNREIQRRSGPFGLNPAQTRGGALLQAPLYAAEGLGELGNFLLDAPSQMGEAALDYFGGPSKFARDVRSGAIPESEIPAGVDLVDLLGDMDPNLGAPEFLPDDYSAGEIFSYDPTGMGLTKSSTPPTPLTDIGQSDADDIQSYLDALDEQTVMSQPVTPDSMTGEETVMSQALKAAKPDTAAMSPEEFRAQEKDIAESGGMMFSEEMLDDAVISGMQDTLKAAGVEDKPAPGESREEALARYKKEFADATGIDISGKTDKSQALMAFGLALMQNKAGKGFNVGKMLSAVGEAGAAAQPELRRAAERADAAKLAAGKYALQQLKAGESAAAALAKEQREAARELNLKLLDLEMQAEEDFREDSKIKNVDRTKVVDGVNISYGIANQNTKLAKPSADAALVSNAWNKYSKGQENINRMLGIVEGLSQENAPAFKTIGDRIKRQLGNFGLRDTKIDFGPEGASDEDKFNAMRLSVINEMKRLIIQESQVSDFDRKMLDASFGEVNLTTTPQQAEFALNEMLGYFGNKKKSLEPVLQHMYDPSYYLSNSEYERTREYLQDSLETPFLTPQARNRDGTPTSKAVASVDLTGGSN